MRTQPEIFEALIHAADVYDEIDRLHDEAEELAARAKHTADPVRGAALRNEATRKVRQAARLRQQIGEA